MRAVILVFLFICMVVSFITMLSVTLEIDNKDREGCISKVVPCKLDNGLVIKDVECVKQTCETDEGLYVSLLIFGILFVICVILFSMVLTIGGKVE